MLLQQALTILLSAFHLWPSFPPYLAACFGYQHIRVPASTTRDQSSHLSMLVWDTAKEYWVEHLGLTEGVLLRLGAEHILSCAWTSSLPND